MTNDKKYFVLHDDWSAYRSHFSSLKQARKTVQLLEQQLAEGFGESGFELALLIDPLNIETPLETDSPFYISNEIWASIKVSEQKMCQILKLTFDTLLKEAEAGNVKAMAFVEEIYQGFFYPRYLADRDKWRYWVNKRLMAEGKEDLFIMDKDMEKLWGK